MPRIFFVLPAYNEAENIGKLLTTIDDTCVKDERKYTVVVVNDGSIDNTEQISLNFADELKRRNDGNSLVHVRNEPNMGLGFTLCRGLTLAAETSNDDDIVVTMDADNTQDPEYVTSMEQAIGKGADIVIASRFVGGGGERGLSLFRKFLSQGASLLLRAFFSSKILDYTSGYRAYKSSVLKNAVAMFGEKLIEEKGFSASPEILIKMLKQNVIVAEVPFLLKYDLKKGESKINVRSTIVAYIKMILRFKKQGF